MKTVLTIKDQLSAGKITNEINVSFDQDLVTVKDIIEARVLQEVESYNNTKPEYFQGLVQPSNAEKTLNGYRMKERKKVDGEKQVYIALDGFNKNVYFVLINGKQAETLDQEVTLSSTTTVNFVKLTPLVGG
jgi:hypothetical protein